MGQPNVGNAALLPAEHIGGRRQAGEVKHLSTPRKGNQRDSLSSGERKGISPNRARASGQALRVRGCRALVQTLIRLAGVTKSCTS